MTGEPFDLLLVTCVYEKADGPRAAKDLYLSPDFARLRRYAERHGKPWFIVSGEHGLIQPDEWLAPYDRNLPDTPMWYQRAWGSWVAARLRLLVGDLDGRTVEIHASPPYVAQIKPRLEETGATVASRLPTSHGISTPPGTTNKSADGCNGDPERRSTARRAQGRPTPDVRHQ